MRADRVVCDVILAPGARAHAPELAARVRAAHPHVPRHACVNDEGDTFAAVMDPRRCRICWSTWSSIFKRGRPCAGATARKPVRPPLTPMPAPLSMPCSWAPPSGRTRRRARAHRGELPRRSGRFARFSRCDCASSAMRWYASRSCVDGRRSIIMKVAVLTGGSSTERELSLASARTCAQLLGRGGP